jgi:hypothetical protein
MRLVGDEEYIDGVSPNSVDVVTGLVLMRDGVE